MNTFADFPEQAFGICHTFFLPRGHGFEAPIENSQSLIDVHRFGDSFFFCAAFFAFALLVRAIAAAREALSALLRRCSGVIALARAKPPKRPISLESIPRCYHRAARVGKATKRVEKLHYCTEQEAKSWRIILTP